MASTADNEKKSDTFYAAIRGIVSLSFLLWFFVSYTLLFAFSTPAMDRGLKLFIYAVWCYPLLAAPAMWIARIRFRKGARRDSLGILSVPLLYGLILFLIAAISATNDWIRETERQRPNVRLHGQGLSEFPMEILNNPVPVDSLDLSGNRLKTLPPEVSQLTELRYLNLSGNDFKTLPAVIGTLDKLVLLKLSNNPLESLPPEIGKLTALKELEISNCSLTDLPEEFGELKALKRLMLNRNRFSTLPLPITKLLFLENLNLSGNSTLTTLPSDIQALRGLEVLDLSDSGLTSLPPELKEMPWLRLLVLNDTPLQKKRARSHR